MNRLSFRKVRKYLVFPLVLLPLLFTNISCVPADEAEVIENLLDNLESMGGEMSFVTKDGKIITVTISQEPAGGDDDPEEKNSGNEDTGDSDNKNKDNLPELGDYLRVLNCIEDVFKTLGVWEDAEILYDQVPNWRHVAEELGYDADSMYAALCTIIQHQLHEAKSLGLITYEQYQYKVGHYSDKALHWVNEIF